MGALFRSGGTGNLTGGLISGNSVVDHLPVLWRQKDGLPFIVADPGNVLGGLFTQFIIRKGLPVSRARKVTAGLFGTVMGFSLILGPLVITSLLSASVVLSVAAFGYAAYTANSMAFPGTWYRKVRRRRCGGGQRRGRSGRDTTSIAFGAYG
ncbi:MAG TPA: hypothetical protein VGN00_12145 [Puia sp.]